MSTRTSSRAVAWQAMRRPAATSSDESSQSSSGVGSESVPWARRTRQPPQVPAPPQIAWSSTPTDCAAARIVVLCGTSARRPTGWRSTTTIPAGRARPLGGGSMAPPIPAGVACGASVADLSAFVDGSPESKDHGKRLSREHPTPRGQADAGEGRVEQPEDLPLARLERPSFHPGADGCRRRAALHDGRARGRNFWPRGTEPRRRRTRAHRGRGRRGGHGRTSG